MEGGGIVREFASSGLSHCIRNGAVGYGHVFREAYACAEADKDIARLSRLRRRRRLVGCSLIDAAYDPNVT